MIGLLWILGVPVFLVAIAVWDGYVLMHLWEWFAVPVFGLPILKLTQAIGVAMVAGFLTSQFHPVGYETRSDMKQFTDAVWFAVCSPAVALLGGWIVKHWV